MSRVVLIKCGAEMCKSEQRVPLAQINKLVPGWIQMVIAVKEVDPHTNQMGDVKAEIYDFCSLDCASKKLRAMKQK